MNWRSGTSTEIHRCRYFVISRHTMNGRTAVRKSVLPGPSSTRATELLRGEHGILLALDVPGVVRPLRWEDEETPTLVLEDAGHEDLEQRLDAGPLRVDAFLDIASELADICARIHAKNVVHRAIAPSRVVLGPGGRVTLIHFVETSARTSLAGAFDLEQTRKLSWISPEQTGRMNRFVDWRSDLYALGATFYAALTGSPPFRSSDPLELAHAHIARMPVPASIVNPRVPPLLADLVQKLLAKMPEQRYQSAEALSADLQQARRQWLASRKIEPFELGQLDLGKELPLAKRLYGRERERAVLRDALARVSTDGTELMLVAGDAGVGKTALVDAMRDAVLARGGWFASGKCDLRAANVPYAPVSEALGALARAVLSEPDAPRAQELRRLREAVGANGRVLAALIPELRAVIGDLPEVPVLDPMEAENRFHLSLQTFVRGVAALRPLVLFLDDLQWADAASLRVLRALVTDAERARVLLLGAFRPRAVGPDHPLARALDELRMVGAVVTRLDLGPLGIDALVALLADLLRCKPDRASPLAALVLAKTGGNPYFVCALLRSLHRDGLLAFDSARGTWTWNLRRIERVGITENVIELTTTAIRRLSEQAQQLLELAACVGKHVDLGTLAALWGKSIDETTASLDEAMREGLLVPEDEHGSKDAGLRARFVHDRVQQAAYALLSDEQQKKLHLQLGRRLLELFQGDELEERLFDVVDHLDLGGDLLAGAERVELASLNRRAGVKARRAAAFEPALAYFRTGLGLLPDGAWRSHYELCFALHCAAAECASLTGDHALCRTLVEEGLAHAASLLDEVSLQEIRIASATTTGEYKTALEWGRAALQAIGLELPREDLGRAVESERQTIRALLGDRSPAVLAGAAHVKITDEDASQRILSAMLPPAWFADRALFVLVAAIGVRCALERGQCAYSMAYSCYSMFLAAVGEFAEAERFSRVALELAERSGDAARQVEASHCHNAFVRPWRQPFASCATASYHDFTLGRQSGQFRMAAYASRAVVVYSFAAGTELDRVLAQLDDGLSFCRRAGNQGMALCHLAYRQAICCLRGATHGRNVFDDGEFDEATFLASVSNEPTVSCLYGILRLETSYLFGDIGAARRWSDAALVHIDLLGGFGPVAEHALFTALTLLSLHDGATATERTELSTRVAGLQDQMRRWEESCAENFRHKRLIVDAEIARVEGHFLASAALYDQAIEEAARAGFVQYTALASERGGRLLRAFGRSRVADAMYLRPAVQAWARWGALEKARALEHEFALDRAIAASSVADEPSRGQVLDALSLLKAAEAITSEIVLERLLGKLMETCIQAAGAERGVLVIEEEGAPFVRASGRAARPASIERTPLEGAQQVPREIIEHVRRTRKVLVLDDASMDMDGGAFVADPYLADGNVKSLLVLPIQRKESLLGAFLFENDLTTHAFTKERVRVLEVLSAQIAIAIENSLLFEKLKVEVDERTRAEQAVRFLASASEALAASLDYPTTLRSLASLVVPTLATWCFIDVIEEDGQIRRVAEKHADPAKEMALRALEERYPPDWTSPHPSIGVLTSGVPIVLPELTEAVVRSHTRDDEHARLLREIGAHSAMAVPLIARGRTLGAITLGTADPARSYGPSDLAVAEELARRAAMAVDNARLYRDAQEGVRVREEFITVASHELRTPIATMRLAIQGLLRRKREPAAEEQVTRALRTTERQIERLLRLIDELLDVSRIGAGRIPLHLEQVDLASVVREAVEQLRERIAQSRSSLRVRAEEPVVGMWDRFRLEQVITNLLDNALKFGAGEPISITVARRNGVAQLTVEDRGIGIPPERLARVFERFERAVSTRNYGGFGLGLYIVRRIVEGLGGAVRVDSTLGAGSRFSVELPCAGPPDPGACAAVFK
ncbi:sensor histidine kinase [Sorangium sp. So ce1097]|uniref:sensor histidine kinase n=1 Tax=Sorangium sp. So ce1097 TaxID=3133330 RepID=UPI003F617ED6